MLPKNLLFYFTEKNRAPPSGCCPAKYMHQCCPRTGDNEPVHPCSAQNKSSSRPGTGGSNITPAFAFDHRTDCVHSWRTQACTGGFYLNVMNGKPQACPAGNNL